MLGFSARHGLHQLAQKSTNKYLPLKLLYADGLIVNIIHGKIRRWLVNKRYAIVNRSACSRYLLHQHAF